jgi:acetyl-CoA synthetase
MGTASGDQPAGASSDKLRHVESMSELPSGAGRISGINAVVLGESLAAEEHDLVYPSAEFSADALVPSPKKV